MKIVIILIPWARSILKFSIRVIVNESRGEAESFIDNGRNVSDWNRCATGGVLEL